MTEKKDDFEDAIKIAEAERFTDLTINEPRATWVKEKNMEDQKEYTTTIRPTAIQRLIADLETISRDWNNGVTTTSEMGYLVKKRCGEFDYFYKKELKES